MRKTINEEVWEEKFRLLLVNAGKPLAAVRKYIKMNPARKAWKDANPDCIPRQLGQLPSDERP